MKRKSGRKRKSRSRAEDLGEDFHERRLREFREARERARPEIEKVAQFLRHAYGPDAVREAESRLAEAMRSLNAAMRTDLVDQAVDEAIADMWMWRDIVLALRTMQS
jgi:hypothetical protein